MAQELKPPGGRRSWRDEARFRLQQALGETGERLGEGLLGESEEDKYLEFLQREYGSELPRDEKGNIDVPLSRPMRESMLDMSDLGMADKALMILSSGGSVAPRMALSSGLLESGMLMGDAKAMVDRGETIPGALTAAFAGLPPAVAAAANRKTFTDLGNEAVSGIGQFMGENVPSIERSSMVTPEGVDVPLYFSKGSGNMTGGGSRMEKQTQTLKQKQAENIENMSDSELDEFIASNEDRLADYADDVARGNELSPEISKSRTTFENRNRIAREVQLNRRKEELIRNHEAMTERMPPDVARRSFPQAEIDEIDEQLLNLGRMQFDGKLQGLEEDFPKLLTPTKGSSMRDSILDDPEINTGELENALAKYNLGFDDMKRIDIDSPEIYNDTVAEGRDLLEELELLTYPRTKKPIYSQEYNEGMGTLDFYDTDSGPIGIMQMDIDDSIDDVVFFIPRSKNVTGKQTQASSRMQQASLKTLSPILSSRRLPGQISNTFSGSNRISATVKGTNNVTGAETIDSIVKDLQDAGITGDNFLSNQRFDVPVRLEGTLNGEKVTFSSVPIGSDEYIVSLRKMGVEGTKVTPIDNKIDDLGKELYDLQNELNQEGTTMSVENYLRKTNRVIELESQIKSLKD